LDRNRFRVRYSPIRVRARIVRLGEIKEGLVKLQSQVYVQYTAKMYVH